MFLTETADAVGIIVALAEQLSWTLQKGPFTH
jgi:hypothetical protein